MLGLEIETDEDVTNDSKRAVYYSNTYFIGRYIELPKSPSKSRTCARTYGYKWKIKKF